MVAPNNAELCDIKRPAPVTASPASRGGEPRVHSLGAVGKRRKQASPPQYHRADDLFAIMSPGSL